MRIQCCGGLRKAKAYVLAPQDGYFAVRMFYLEKCPVCLNSALVLARMDFEHKITKLEKRNIKAEQLFEKLKSGILYEEKQKMPLNLPASSFYLNYNEYGRKKRCYSNIRTLKMGMFESRDLKKSPEFIYTAV